MSTSVAFTSTGVSSNGNILFHESDFGNKKAVVSDRILDGDQMFHVTYEDDVLIGLKFDQDEIWKDIPDDFDLELDNVFDILNELFEYEMKGFYAMLDYDLLDPNFDKLSKMVYTINGVEHTVTIEDFLKCR